VHIPDGMVPGAVSVTGYALTGAAMWFSLKKINQKKNPRKEIPKVSLLTAAFFIATFILLPIPPASVHPLLVGIIGAILGYYAFPSITIALIFQAALFQHGGITTLGVNAFIFGSSALLSYYLYLVLKKVFRSQIIIGFLTGITGVAVTVFFFYIMLVSFIPANLDVQMEQKAIMALVIAHVPLMVLEGLFTALLFRYLQKVKPELLEGG